VIIDAHLHIWDPTRIDYPWLTSELAPIDRTIPVDEVLGDLEESGVGGAILVQAADDPAETAHLLAAAAQHPEVVGVVGWVPLDEPERAGADLERLRSDPLFVGVRSLIHDRADPDWILGPQVGEGLELLAAAGVPYDFVTSGPAALALLPELAERHPDLTIVLDHLGKPPVGGSPEAIAPWRDLLTRAAENPRLVAKVSGLYPPGDDLAAWTPGGVSAVIDIALEVFGPDRLMYGSDWPISVLAGGYRRVWAALSSRFELLAPGERAAVLGGTAERVYALPRREDVP
jgi:L-fuconolactonase